MFADFEHPTCTVWFLSELYAKMRLSSSTSPMFMTCGWDRCAIRKYSSVIAFRKCAEARALNRSMAALVIDNEVLGFAFPMVLVPIPFYYYTPRPMLPRMQCH